MPLEHFFTDAELDENNGILELPIPKGTSNVEAYLQRARLELVDKGYTIDEETDKPIGDTRAVVFYIKPMEKQNA